MKRRIWGILIPIVGWLLIFLITLLIPIEKQAVYWIGFAFFTLAFVLQIPVWNLAFPSGKNGKNRLLGVSVATLGTIYVIVQTALFLVFYTVKTKPWICTVSCVAVFGIFILLLFAAMYSKERIGSAYETRKAAQAFSRDLMQDVQTRKLTEKDPEKIALLNELENLIRYGDPVGRAETEELEKRIRGLLRENPDKEDLSTAITLYRKRGILLKSIKS